MTTLAREDICQLTTTYSAGMAALLHSGHFYKCENDRRIATHHVVPLKTTKAEESVKTAHHFLHSQERYSFKNLQSGLSAKNIIS